jgi:hypothetical protein
MGDIPPPLKLNRPQPMQPDQIMLPFTIADTPRMFLNFLANESAIPKRHREVIAEWMLDHNRVLGEYLLQTYGHRGAELANRIAQTMYDEFLQKVAEQRQDAENELFDRLEREIGNGDASSD